MIQLKIDDLRRIISNKHFLVQDANPKSVFEITERLIGLHSARLISPYATVASRIPGYSPQNLTQELFEKHSLIKVRCMRKTLHTVTLDLAPIVHQATKKVRLSICKGLYKKLKMEPYLIQKLRSQILIALKNRELSSQEIESLLSNGKHGTEKEKIRAVIKELWEEGSICYLNRSGYWGREKRYYALTKEKYPELKLDNISPQMAQRELFLRHIKHYGPVTLEDMRWWSGLPLSAVKDSITYFSSEIVTIKVEGWNSDFFLHEEDLTNPLLRRSQDFLTLLAYEDPTLKGYYESRQRYIDPQNYQKLFNTIGEARASIMKNGEVIGIWSWDKKQLDINIELFNNITKVDRTRLHDQIVYFREYLRSH